MMQKTKIAIGLGSNLGDRQKAIQDAFTHLREDVLEEATLSALYETEPWGIKEQPGFLNAVAVGFSDWAPSAILNYLKRLETDLGRKPGLVNGPRLIDLDLLAWGEKTFTGEGVEVPHPRMAERDFVLLPLFEVWPEWEHPIYRKSIGELLESASVITRPHVISSSGR